LGFRHVHESDEAHRALVRQSGEKLRRGTAAERGGNYGITQAEALGENSGYGHRISPNAAFSFAACCARAACGQAAAAPPSSAMNSRRFVDGSTLSTASAINATAPSLQRKDIDRAALRHLGILAGEQQIHARLHLGRVDAPTGLHRDILLAV